MNFLFGLVLPSLVCPNPSRNLPHHLLVNILPLLHAPVTLPNRTTRLAHPLLFQSQTDRVLVASDLNFELLGSGSYTLTTQVAPWGVFFQSLLNCILSSNAV